MILNLESFDIFCFSEGNPLYNFDVCLRRKPNQSAFRYTIRRMGRSSYLNSTWNLTIIENNTIDMNVENDTATVKMRTNSISFDIEGRSWRAP